MPRHEEMAHGSGCPRLPSPALEIQLDKQVNRMRPAFRSRRAGSNRDLDMLTVFQTRCSIEIDGSRCYNSARWEKQCCRYASCYFASRWV
jgi:hypothetical protein